MQRHTTGIDDDITWFDTPFAFQNFRYIRDGLIGGGEPVVIEAAHAPNEVEGSQHVHAIGEDVDICLRPVTRNFECGVARACHTDNCFGIDLHSRLCGIEANDIGMERPGL